MRNLALITIALFLSGCGIQQTKDFDDDSAVLMFESAVSSINSGANDVEQSPAYSQNKSVNILPEAYAASCSLNRFTPMVGSANCVGTEDDKTVISNFDSCTVGNANQFVLTGSVKLMFDSAGTCSSWINGGLLPTSGYVVRTADSFVRSNWNGSYVKTDSNAHSSYLGQSISGGIKTTFTDSSRTFDILGLHRQRFRGDGSKGFDHSVYTTSPVVTAGSRLSGNRSIQSGAIRVDHNRARYSATTNLSGLVWDNSCCHPVSGTLTFDLSGSVSGKFLINFGTNQCGLVDVTDQNGNKTQVELYTCE